LCPDPGGRTLLGAVAGATATAGPVPVEQVWGDHMQRLSRSFKLVAGMLAAALAAAVTACTPATVPPAGLSCAWAYKTDPSTLNVAYPDSGATYWTTSYNLVAGDSLVLSGTFPDARYMGFITYTPAGNVVDALTDRDIAPDPGSDNPFATPGATPGGTYTVEVAGTAPIGSPDNVVNPNGILGSVIYRVYLGNGDATGGVGLPQMSVRRTDGTVVPLPTCGNPGTDAGLVNLVNTFGPATDVPADHPPLFKRPANVAGLYVNPDNGYVAAVASHEAGRVLVVRGAAPTVPDTQAGVSPAAPSQMRYWSLCTNEYRKPYPVTDCVNDTSVPVASDGTYTIVVSLPEDRPANATTENGVAWLNWGSTDQDILLLMRNMLPAADFHQSVFDVPLGQAATAMGAYQPVTVECSTASFEADAASCS
jgi:hypothetical protein